MGINGGGVLLSGSKVVFNNHSFANMTIAVDVAYLIWARLCGAGENQILSDDGKNLTALHGVMLTLNNLRQQGAKLLICFDNPRGNPNKVISNKKRADAREQNDKKLAESTTDEERKKYELRTLRPDEEMFRTVRQACTMFGFDTYEVGFGFEAEQLASWLVNTGVADAVLSVDTDTVLLFGAKKVIMSKSSEYVIVELSNVLDRLGVTFDELQVMSIKLGCDFVEKTRGAGPKTIFSPKYKAIELTQEQNRVLTWIRSYNGDHVKTPGDDWTIANIAAASTWISGIGLNFNRWERLAMPPREITRSDESEQTDIPVPELPKPKEPVVEPVVEMPIDDITVNMVV